jgi:hypothetical protein
MRKSTTAVAVGTALSALLAGAAVMPSVATAAGGNRVIHVKVTGKAITFADEGAVAPGFAVFNVETPRGHHDLQLQQLAAGYTYKEASEDFVKAFEKGRLGALARIYKNIDFQGGATATADKNARFAVTLQEGTYIVTSGDSLHEKLQVSGPAVDGGSIEPDAVIRAVTNDDGMQLFRSKKELAHRGWLKFKNKATQPHFLLLQKVAKSTTRKDVNEYFQGDGSQDPPWLRAAFDETGLISPDRAMYYHFNLPRGRYLMVCFMPDVDTGAPHGVMGMFKLVKLV